MDLTMAIFSYFGIAAAAGVVVNDNLVLMDYCNKLRDKGMPAKEAIIEAGVVRFRPILLTSVTTIAGLMPMMLERSIQAAFLQPIVVSLAFGVLLAFFVTLFMVPALYGIGLDIKSTWKKYIYRGQDHESLESNAEITIGPNKLADKEFTDKNILKQQ